MKDIILTGVRSNEEPTLANYLGAFVPMVNMQRQHAGEYQLNMFVPDLHSFTTPIDHGSLYQKTLTNLKYFIAAGLDINNPDTYIYRQSYISAHSELTWILDCFTYMGEMSRMTQFKDKGGTVIPKSELAKIGHLVDEELKKLLLPTEKYNEAFARVMNSIHEQFQENNSTSVGLFNYPVLMASDILLYNAKYVPVGEDQFQHLEITRDIATRFNNKFGEVFTVPLATKEQTSFIQRDTGLRIRSLSDPTKKMSKSSQDEKSKILLSDDPAVAAKKIMSATTDSLGEIHFNFETQPGISSLLQILALLSGRPQEEVNAEWEGNAQYGEFKKAVAAEVERFLTDFQARFNAIDDSELIAKLEASEAAMAETANQTLLRAQQAVGLRPRGQ